MNEYTQAHKHRDTQVPVEREREKRNKKPLEFIVHNI